MNYFQVSYQLLADKLMEAGSAEECLAVNRAAIYNLVQKYVHVNMLILRSCLMSMMQAWKSVKIKQ